MKKTRTASCLNATVSILNPAVSTLNPSSGSTATDRRQRERKKLHSPHNQESGVALILVLFIVSLATILVTQMAYTGTLDMRLHLISKRSLEAEYLLKSAMNVGRVLLKADETPEDSALDGWAIFSDGLEIPSELLEVNDPSVRVELEIRPLGAKFHINSVGDSRGADVFFRDILVRLMESLSFDNDEETPDSGPFEGNVFAPQQLVANLIDYIDEDSESYDAPNFARGLEDQIPDGQFANQFLLEINELYQIPGFTPQRVSRLSPFITKEGPRNTININFAPREILEAYHIDITAANVDEIINFRQTTAFNENNKTDILTDILGATTYNEVQSRWETSSRRFQIISKVDYGSSSVFMRTIVIKEGAGTLPSITSSQVFS